MDSQRCLNSESMTLSDHLFKTLLIGEMSVGKSSLFNRFDKGPPKEGDFTGEYQSTIGVDL